MASNKTQLFGFTTPMSQIERQQQQQQQKEYVIPGPPRIIHRIKNKTRFENVYLTHEKLGKFLQPKFHKSDRQKQSVKLSHF